MNMQKNVGKTDKIIRVVLGIAIIGVGVVFNNWLGVIGIVPIATALMGWCPPYAILGINTCGTNENTEN